MDLWIIYRYIFYILLIISNPKTIQSMKKTLLLLTVITCFALIQCKKDEGDNKPVVNYLTLHVVGIDSIQKSIPMPNLPIKIFGEKYTGFSSQVILFSGTTDDSGHIRIPEDSIKDRAILENNAYKIYVVAASTGTNPMAIWGQYYNTLSQKIYLEPSTGKYKYDTVSLNYDLLYYLKRYDKWVYSKSYVGTNLVADSLIKPCSKDNYLTFAYASINASGQMYIQTIFNEGASICDSTKLTSAASGYSGGISYQNHKFSGNIGAVAGDASVFGNSAYINVENDTVKLTGTFYTPSIYQATTYFVPVK